MSEIKSGTDAIRAALKAWSFKINLASLARDLGLPTDHLEKFIASGPLSDDAIKGLTKILWHGHAEFDAEAEPAPAHEPARGSPPGLRPAADRSCHAAQVQGRPPWARTSARDAAEG